ncbi:cellulase family glycosylhydrolase [Chitinispirillales bacterium ANBcel5]|uniref:cellulase family glycosylhydrolase n=1 Tax=Cellulosispirillum alkaliphilum TaxID=3039283 RepID=UPI002A55D618|nr:cellulase family glycosylhydrolase [Chitinispirillales bacterium ANBcel5]
MVKRLMLLSCLLISTLTFSVFAFTETPVELNGALRVDGNRIVGEHGEPVQLKGMSLYWSIWGPQKYYNPRVVNWLVEDWRIDVIRTAMAVEKNLTGEDVGWIYNRENQTHLVETVIEAAIENGIYVIVDWHTHEIHTEAAKEFFSHMAEKYGNTPNLIWEIFNEPVDQSWEEIAEYSEEVISAIREHCDNLVIAGTRTWSQRVDEPAANPLSDDNTAYALHFYAGSHGQSLRDVAEQAMDDGIALFITEWGTSHADGGRKHDRNVYKAEADEWIIWALEHDLSMANWSLGDIDEASAALRPGASPRGRWRPGRHLTESGKFVRQWIRDINTVKYDDGSPRLVVDTDGPGSITVSPEKEYYDLGETVTLTAKPDENANFVRWAGSVTDTEQSLTVTMDGPKRIRARFQEEVEFQSPGLVNGDFSEGRKGWTWFLFTDHDADASLDISDNQARVEIKNKGTNYWNIQIFQGDLTLMTGHTYRLTFDASADEPRDILVAFKHNEMPHTEYYGEKISLSPEMTTFTAEFTMENDNDDNARLEFNLGELSDIPVTISNVNIEVVE